MVVGTLKSSRGGAVGALLSPFKGGLNNVGGGGSIEDAQLAVLQNFDVDTDGSLVNRPAIENTSILPPTGVATDPSIPLGYYTRADGATFLVATCGGKTWIFDLTLRTWTSIWDNVAADFAQYDNKIVMISEFISGGYWEGGAFTATNTMPKGSGIVVYNERFWAFGPKGGDTATTIYFSNLTAVSPSTSIYTWTVATDFFVVDKGDGQWITAIIADPNALLIFRNSSTYQFTYPNAPANGSLSKLNSSIGADHRWAIVQYENYYWVLNQGFLYQFISYQFYARNAQLVRFSQSGVSTRYIDQALSVIGERIVVYYYGSLYAYNVRQQVWSEWSSMYTPARILQMPADASGFGPRKALGFNGAASAVTGANNLLHLTDSPSEVDYDGEDMTCTMRTKTYDFNTAGVFKRMTYWSVGFRSASGVTGTAVPVGVNGSSATFDEMDNHTFDDFDRGGWDAPIIVTPTFVDNIPFPSASPVHALARAKAAFRFLSAYYEVTLQTKGTPATAPARVFSVTAFLKQHSRTKEQVS